MTKFSFSRASGCNSAGSSKRQYYETKGLKQLRLLLNCAWDYCPAFQFRVDALRYEEVDVCV